MVYWRLLGMDKVVADHLIAFLFSLTSERVVRFNFSGSLIALPTICPVFFGHTYSKHALKTVCSVRRNVISRYIYLYVVHDAEHTSACDTAECGVSLPAGAPCGMHCTPTHIPSTQYRESTTSRSPTSPYRLSAIMQKRGDALDGAHNWIA